MPGTGRRSRAAPDAARPGLRAQAVADFIREHGASFFDELVEGTRPAALPGRGRARRAGGARPRDLGQLRRPARAARALRPSQARRRRAAPAPQHPPFGMEDAGRWALAHRARPAPAGPQASPEAVEHVARRLLLRYGVVFWRLLEREADWLPPWRDLLRVYRRLEARGEIRGGRFVAGFSGEQFALPDAVGMLREVRRQPASDAWVSLSGADPLNLVGILTPGAEARRADRQPPALPERPADRGPRRRRGAVSREAGPRHGMGGSQGPAARCRAGTARRSGLKPAPPTRSTSVRRGHAGQCLPVCTAYLPRAGHPP